MRKKNKIIALIFVAFFAFCITACLSEQTFAAWTCSGDLCPNNNGDGSELRNGVLKIAGDMSILVGALAALMVIWASIQYSLSLGNPSKAEKAKKTILFAAIGVAIGVSVNIITGIGQEIGNAAAGGFGGLAGVVQNLRNGLLAVTLPAAILAIMYGGILMVTSSGNPQKVQTGKKSIIAGIIGFLISVFAGILVSLVVIFINSSYSGSATVETFSYSSDSNGNRSYSVISRGMSDGGKTVTTKNGYYQVQCDEDGKNCETVDVTDSFYRDNCENLEGASSEIVKLCSQLQIDDSSTLDNFDYVGFDDEDDCETSIKIRHVLEDESGNLQRDGDGNAKTVDGVADRMICKSIYRDSSTNYNLVDSLGSDYYYTGVIDMTVDKMTEEGKQTYSQFNENDKWVKTNGTSSSLLDGVAMTAEVHYRKYEERTCKAKIEHFVSGAKYSEDESSYDCSNKVGGVARVNLQPYIDNVTKNFKNLSVSQIKVNGSAIDARTRQYDIKQDSVFVINYDGQCFVNLQYYVDGKPISVDGRGIARISGNCGDNASREIGTKTSEVMSLYDGTYVLSEGTSDDTSGAKFELESEKVYKIEFVSSSDACSIDLMYFDEKTKLIESSTGRALQNESNSDIEFTLTDAGAVRDDKGNKFGNYSHNGDKLLINGSKKVEPIVAKKRTISNLRCHSSYTVSELNNYLTSQEIAKVFNSSNNFRFSTSQVSNQYYVILRR